jgi:hypothetical protein
MGNGLRKSHSNHVQFKTSIKCTKKKLNMNNESTREKVSRMSFEKCF